MPAYVVLYTFTNEGRRNIKRAVGRAQEVREENEKRGFKVLGHFWTQGQYDLITIVDAPDEKSMMAGLFSIAEAGNVSSQTLRAFTDDEMQSFLQTHENAPGAADID